MRPLACLSILLIFALAGCGSYGGPPITRTVGGERHTGIFVSPFSYEHFVRAELASIAGDLRQAEQEYRLARAGPEDDPLLIARLADVVDRQGREEEALALLDEGERLDAESELIWLTRGQVHERHGRLDEATQAYARAASVAPRSEAGPLALAALLRARGEPAEADAVLARYLERASGAGAARARLAIAIERGQGQAAAEAVRSLLEFAPARADEVRGAVVTALEDEQPALAQRLLAALPPRPEDRALRLRAAIAAGDREGAEGLLARWMPAGPAELVVVAQGYLAIGMAEQAEELARMALAEEGGTSAQLVHGEALRALGRLGEAAAALARVDPGTGGFREARLELAETLRQAGRPALAAEVLGRARPDFEVARALAEARMEAGDADGALAALEAPELRAARALLLERLGRVDEAAAIYAGLAEAADLVGETADAERHTAGAAEAADSAAEAASEAATVAGETAAAVFADDAELDLRTRVRARAERAWQRGDRERAVATLQAWTARAPEDLLSRARHAELLAALGRGAEASEIAEAALALSVEPVLRRRLRTLTGAR